MSETIKYIKKFNVGDRVTSTNTILLDRGFRGVSGIIKSIVKDNFDSWQYLIQLDDGRELQCDDCHLETTQLDDNQQIVLDWLKYPLNEIPNRFAQDYFAYVTCLFLGQAPEKVLKAHQGLSPEQQLQVLSAWADWGLEQEEEK
ncbi:hypothetical protein D920_00094 [Enterococcus faecalis 13-SD-W-01]|nr:hypothetical protein D920_00094 [Enterococcus faecalis 13-SD-W-01]